MTLPLKKFIKYLATFTAKIFKKKLKSPFPFRSVLKCIDGVGDVHWNKNKQTVQAE